MTVRASHSITINGPELATRTEARRFDDTEQERLCVSSATQRPTRQETTVAVPVFGTAGTDVSSLGTKSQKVRPPFFHQSHLRFECGCFLLQSNDTSWPVTIVTGKNTTAINSPGRTTPAGQSNSTAEQFNRRALRSQSDAAML